MELNEKKKAKWNVPAGIEELPGRRGQVRCGLCLGELYPGDPYFWLEGQRICEACLERYAQRCFAHRRRRMTGWEGERP